MLHANLSLNLCRRASISSSSISSSSIWSKPWAHSATIAPGRRCYAASKSQTALKKKEEFFEQDTDVHCRVEMQDSKKLKSGVRALLRDIAQPVAVVTSILPPPKSTSYAEDEEDEYLNAGSRNLEDPIAILHGATLSSFTSIAMDPYPLVSFALRIPSRMADALTALARSGKSGTQAHMVINLLSASQASTAVKFSRPDLYPTPFAVESSSRIPHTLSHDGYPIIDGAIGAISCRLVGMPMPLFDLDYLEPGTARIPEQAIMPRLEKGEVASELFIARVLRVETVQNGDTAGVEVEDSCEGPLPLVYHRRSYTSCHPKP